MRGSLPGGGRSYRTGWGELKRKWAALVSDRSADDRRLCVEDIFPDLGQLEMTRGLNLCQWR